MFDRSRICRHGEGQGTFLVRTCDARGIPRSRSCPSIVLRLAPLYHALTLSSNDYFDVRVSVDSALPLTTRQVTMTSPAHEAASTQREATRGQPPPLPPRLQSQSNVFTRSTIVLDPVSRSRPYRGQLKFATSSSCVYPWLHGQRDELQKLPSSSSQSSDSNTCRYACGAHKALSEISIAKHA
jgi:hypothetical protein